MNTTIVFDIIEQWCKKNCTPMRMDDLAIVLAHRLNQCVDYDDLRDKLDILIALNKIHEPSVGMFQV